MGKRMFYVYFLNRNKKKTGRAEKNMLNNFRFRLKRQKLLKQKRK